MHAMMQARMQKVEKSFVFFITKLGLLQGDYSPFIMEMRSLMERLMKRCSPEWR